MILTRTSSNLKMSIPLPYITRVMAKLISLITNSHDNVDIRHILFNIVPICHWIGDIFGRSGIVIHYFG
jgi:hypothetical protein